MVFVTLWLCYSMCYGITPKHTNKKWNIFISQLLKDFHKPNTDLRKTVLQLNSAKGSHEYSAVTPSYKL